MPSKFVVENTSEFRENVTVDSSKLVKIGSDPSGIDVIKMMANDQDQYIQVGTTSDFKVDQHKLYLGEAKTGSYCELTKSKLVVGQDASANALTTLTNSSLTINDLGSSGMKLDDSKLRIGTDSSGVILQNSKLQLHAGAFLERDGQGDLKLQVSTGNFLQIKHCGQTQVGGHKEAHHPYFESKDASGNQKLKGYLPVLDVNHQIPLSYLQSSFSFDGRLKFRHFVCMIWDTRTNEWVLDVGSSEITRPMASLDNWYSGTQSELDPAYDGSGDPASGMYHNFAFATGSFFLVTYSKDKYIDGEGEYTDGDSVHPAPAPFHTSISHILSELGDKGYLKTYQDASGSNWYSDGMFAPIAQTDDYETSHSDMIVIRNNKGTLASVEVTVIDNTDEFQMRLINENEVHFPVAGGVQSPPTMKVTDQILHVKAASADAKAIHLDSSLGGVTVDASGSIALKSSNDNTPSSVSITALLGGIDVDSNLKIDMDAKGAIELTSSSSDASGAIRLTSSGSTDAAAVIVSAEQGGIDVNAKKTIDMDAEGAIELTSSSADASGAIRLTSSKSSDHEAIMIRAAEGGASVITKKQVYVKSTDSNISVSAKTNLYLTSQYGSTTIDSSGVMQLKSDSKIHVGNTATTDTTDFGGALNLTTNGGIYIQSNKKQRLQSSDASDNAIYLRAVQGGIDIDSKKVIDMNAEGAIQLTSSKEDPAAVRLQATGTSGGIQLESKEDTSLTAVQIQATKGGVYITSDISGNKADALKMKASSLNTSTSAISLNAAGGGVTLTGKTGVTLTAPLIKFGDNNSTVLINKNSALSIGGSASQRVYEAEMPTGDFASFELALKAGSAKTQFDDLTVLEVSVVGSDNNGVNAFFKGTFVVEQDRVPVLDVNGDPTDRKINITCTAGNYFKSDKLQARVFYRKNEEENLAENADLLVLAFRFVTGQYSTQDGGKFTARVESLNSSEDRRDRYKFVSHGGAANTFDAAKFETTLLE